MQRQSKSTSTRRALFAAVMVAVLTGVASVPLVKISAAAGKATYTGLSGAFGCTGVQGTGGFQVSPAGCLDAILGDGNPYVGVASDTSAGSFFYTSGTISDLWLRINPNYKPQRYAILDFGPTPADAPCGNNCRKNFEWAKVTSIQLAQGMLVRPVYSNGDPIPGGMEKLPLDTPVDATMLLNFPDPAGRKLYWTIRFNPKLYTDSGYLSVTRTATDSWTVTADAGARAGLIASTDGTRNQTKEGLYSMPFTFIVTR